MARKQAPAAETIFALATAAMRAGVAVLRVSGPQALPAATALTGRADLPPRHACFLALRDPQTGKLLDQALVLFFRAPASFTGEDTVEFHLHGGRAVIDGVSRALAALPGLRMAEPGEFTRRAFENGKVDLTAAEAVADLIAAETESQRLQALDQLGGGLERLYRGWTDRLAGLLAHQEADIEFPEDDLPAGLSDSLTGAIDALMAELQAHLDDDRRGERLRDGTRIVITGAPNAGKSSLLNALMRRDVAIVSDQAGTTRDVIETHLDLGGYPVILADTAGLRDGVHDIEAEGIRRAVRAAADADFRIALFDAGADISADEVNKHYADAATLVVFNKSDLPQASIPAGALAISAVTGAGVDVLIKALTEKVSGFFAKSSGPALTRERHRAAILEALTALQRGRAAPLPELAAEDMRLALRALGRITGRVHVEELLDKIFRDFCIGK